MGSSRFSDAFKRDAVAQITERGCPVRDVSERPGGSPYSPCAWKRTFAKASSAGAETRQEARRDVFDDIGMFCNPKRKHARTGMPSPLKFERQQKLRHEGVQDTRGHSMARWATGPHVTRERAEPVPRIWGGTCG
ncbi:hypothetical protein DSD19_07175 [Rhodovulum sp. BSW8]|nr:hypothetical protein DSD19_07175 [Rhodovulum sp. BSW8]